MGKDQKPIKAMVFDRPIFQLRSARRRKKSIKFSWWHDNGRVNNFNWATNGAEAELRTEAVFMAIGRVVTSAQTISSLFD